MASDNTELCINFCFKDPAPQILISSVVYMFQCGLFNESYYITENVLQHV